MSTKSIPSARPKRRKRPLPVSKNRFDGKSGELLTQEDVEVGRDLRAYLFQKGKVGWNAADLWIVLCMRGYSHPAFAAVVKDFINRINELQRRNRGGAMVSEAMAIVGLCGLTREGEA